MDFQHERQVRMSSLHEFRHDNQILRSCLYTHFLRNIQLRLLSFMIFRHDIQVRMLFFYGKNSETHELPACSGDLTELQWYLYIWWPIWYRCAYTSTITHQWAISFKNSRPYFSARHLPLFMSQELFLAGCLTRAIFHCSCHRSCSWRAGLRSRPTFGRLRLRIKILAAPAPARLRPRPL